MNLKNKALLGITLTIGALGAHAAFAQAAKAKLSSEQARVLALKAVPGTVLKEELEKEKGVLIYSFKIRPSGAASGQHKEVNLDANTGVVVGIEGDDEKEEGDDKE